MADSYVCSGAKIKCSCGDKISTLTVFPNRTVFLTGQPVANISDHVSLSNIAPFGKCHTVAFPPTGAATSANHGRLTPMPCVPGTVSEWLNGKGDYIIKGRPALLKSSYCRCQWGGIITITVDGQTDTGSADLSKEAVETQEQWNVKQDNRPDTVQQPESPNLGFGNATRAKSPQMINDELLEEHAWNNMEQALSPSSWNPFTVKEISQQLPSTQAPQSAQLPEPEMPLAENVVTTNKNIVTTNKNYVPTPNYGNEKSNERVGKKLDIII